MCNQMCNQIRLFGVKYSSKLPYKLENSKFNIFRHIYNANNETIMHSYAFLPLRLAFYYHKI